VISGLPAFSLYRPSPQVIKAQIIPAPNGGINVVDMLAATPQFDSIYQYNLIPAQYGCRARTGITQWGTTIGTGGVNTILPYNGSVSANDKLFAAGKNGIFDITIVGQVNPAALIVFPTIDSNSGFGTSTAVATLAGTYLLYTDESNGYYVYTEGTGWAKPTQGAGATQINNVDPATFVWVVSHKERVWFVQRNTATAWYLATGAVFGAATQFNFGNKFRRGGYLVGLYTWTLDGGTGIDDYLVAISSSGDVLIYQGTDPSVATSWSLVGEWYIGPPPAGRRNVSAFGGDLYVLSSYGLLPLSKLIAGVLIQNQTEYVSRKISPLINSIMTALRTTLGWEVRLVPSENLLLISTPPLANYPRQQFVQSLNTQGWAIYRDLPYNTGNSWNGAFYIGDTNGSVYLHTGNTDLGLAIKWSMLSSFQEYEETGRYHRVHIIRPVFLSLASPSFAVQVKYDYDLSEVLAPVSSGLLSGALWDVGLWDVGLWGGGSAPISVVRGGAGLGRAMAVGLNGSSTSDTTLLRFDLMFDTGNYL